MPVPTIDAMALAKLKSYVFNLMHCSPSTLKTCGFHVRDPCLTTATLWMDNAMSILDTRAILEQE